MLSYFSQIDYLLVARLKLEFSSAEMIAAGRRPEKAATICAE